jgi:predicted nucleic acid-binding protein
MAATVLVDTGFLLAILARRDHHHRWAASVALRYPPPWQTCEAVLSETFHLLGETGRPSLTALLQRGALSATFNFQPNREPVLALLQRYANVPASFADACLVRMSEILPDPVLLTADTDFRIYRRNGRQTVPCEMPG